MLKLIGLISLLARVVRVRSRLWLRSGLGVLGKRSLASGELVHDVLNGFPLGIVPGLVRSGRGTDLRNWLFLDLGRLTRRRARGTGQSIEWGRKLEQRFASWGFRALLLPLGANRLGSRFWTLICGLISLRKVVLIYLRPRMVFLRLGRDEGGRCGNRCRCGLRKRRGRIRVVGDRGSAEVKEVRNGLETIGDGSQKGARKKVG